MRTRGQAAEEEAARLAAHANHRRPAIVDGTSSSDSDDANDASSHSVDSDDDRAKQRNQRHRRLPTPPPTEEKLGRGCRERRPTEFYETTRTPRRVTRAYSKQLESKHHGTSPEEVDALFLRHSKRLAAQEAIQSMRDDDRPSDRRRRGSSTTSDESDASTVSTYTRVVEASRNSRASRMKRAASDRHGHNGHRPHRREGDDDVAVEDDDAFRDDSDDDGRIGSDTDSSDGITDITKEQALAVAKKSGPINTVLRSSKALSNALSAAAGVAKKDLERRFQRPTPPVSNPGGNGEGTAAPDKAPTLAELGDVTALAVDPSINFSRVGGLPEHVVTLRESVLIPLLYPALMERLQLRPPRGLLFVGPPGTGKTLMARALANEATPSGRKITFFMRKGADILSKWVGESERQLRLLFDAAKEHQPSVIFFDEIDGLAPVRHSKQEQSQAALVSTLLALLDGLDDRGQVVVIGATNRVDTIDPALRRPGRFDRELFFPLPDINARRHIVRLHLAAHEKPGKKKSGAPPPPAAIRLEDSIVDRIVRETQGFSGADLAAVITEGRLCALRRSLPQIYVDSRRLKVGAIDATPQAADFILALRRIQPSLQRSSSSDDGLVALDGVTQELCTSHRERVTEALRTAWQPAAEAVKARERASAVEDLDSVAARLTRVPALSIASQVAVVVSPAAAVANASARAAFAGPEHDAVSTYDDAVTVATAVAKSLPTIPIRVLHLPQLLATVIDSTVAPPTSTEFDGMAHGAATSAMSFVQSLRRCSPCFAMLFGFPEWAQRADAESISGLKYWLSTLGDSDVAFVIPTDAGGLAIVESVLPDVVARLLHVHVKGPSLTDVTAAVERVVSQMVDHATSAQRPAQWPELPVDDEPVAPAATEPVRKHRTPEERRMAVERWQRITYKRTQLRHILRQWLMGFINNKMYALFADADLDFTPSKDAADLKKWRLHTRGRRIGLLDILEKLDNAEYTCLSQYNADIDCIFENVKTFFARDANGLRYHTRARQLRDATILNNHKIHPNLVAFTEETKEEDEPEESSDEDNDGREEGDDDEEEEEEHEDHNGEEHNAEGGEDVKPPPPPRRPKKKSKRRRTYGTPVRRRRPLPKKASVTDGAPPTTPVAVPADPSNVVPEHDDAAAEVATAGVDGPDEISKSVMTPSGRSTATLGLDSTAQTNVVEADHQASPHRPSRPLDTLHMTAPDAVALISARLIDALGSGQGFDTQTSLTLPLSILAVRRRLSEALRVWALSHKETAPTEEATVSPAAHALSVVTSALFLPSSSANVHSSTRPRRSITDV